MPKYTPKVLKRLLHPAPIKPQHSPHRHTPIKYGKKSEQQMTPMEEETKTYPTKYIREIQSIAGSILHYRQAMDYTTLPALNDISREQTKPASKTKKDCIQLLYCVATHPQVCTRYHASDMVLHVDSDAACLVLPGAKSRIASFYCLSDHPNKTTHPFLNGAILVECKTSRQVVLSVAEAEVAGA